MRSLPSCTVRSLCSFRLWDCTVRGSSNRTSMMLCERISKEHSSFAETIWIFGQKVQNGTSTGTEREYLSLTPRLYSLFLRRTSDHNITPTTMLRSKFGEISCGAKHVRLPMSSKDHQPSHSAFADELQPPSFYL